MPKLLEVTSLTRREADDGVVHEVLRGVTLDMADGEFVTVMGPSGSGKSTLLHCLSGLDRPTSGTAKLVGQDLFVLSERDRTLLRRRQIGFVFQFFNLLPDLTVRENVILPLLIAGENPKLHAARIDELLARLDIAQLAARQPHGLSGGEMQRVSIARALVTRPPLLLADEPTGNLSSRAGEETMALFREIVGALGTAILLVTHNPRDAAFGDRVLFLVDGALDPAHELPGPNLDAAAVFSRLEELGI